MLTCFDDAEMLSGSWESLVKEADELLKTLFPICRSITGNGTRQSLSILQGVADFDIYEIPSGTVCYDWVVPDEWNVSDAYIEDVSGKKIADFQNNNLHLVGYSIPVDRTVSFQELQEHLHTLPDLPDAIPYRTSYYSRNWGFCLSHNEFQRLNTNTNYHVFIDSTLKSGSLTLGESLIKGQSGKEFLISTYCCHPSMANDNLSGMVLWALLLRELRSRRSRHSYRFVIVPETIGAIAYLSQNEAAMRKVQGGFVITTVAGPGKLGYKHTFLGDHLIDRVVHKTFSDLNLEYVSYPFDIKGSDERQYSAPYFRIPVGTITKDKYYEYDYYHTSMDNLDFVSASVLVETMRLYLSAIEIIEVDLTYRSLNPHCEPMFSKRGLYPQLGGQISQPALDLSKNHVERTYSIANGQGINSNQIDAARWLMFYCDGQISLLDIAEKTGLPMKQLYRTAEKVQRQGLLEHVTQGEQRQ